MKRRPVPLPPILAVTAALALVGCSSTPGPKVPDAGAAGGAAAPALTGDPWRWVATQTPVEWIVPDDPAKYTLQFGADGSLALRADCNRGHATYTAGADGALAIGPAAVTRALCPAGSFDDRYLRQLGNVAHYFFRGDTLYIDQKVDSGTMRFVRGPATTD